MSISVDDNMREKIRQRRIERKIASTELAAMIGKRRDYISQLENGRIKKIERRDLISIYKIVCDVDDEEAEEGVDALYSDTGNIDFFDKEPIFNMYLDRMNQILRNYYDVDSYSAVALCSNFALCLESDITFVQSFLQVLATALAPLDDSSKQKLSVDLRSAILEALIASGKAETISNSSDISD